MGARWFWLRNRWRGIGMGGILLLVIGIMGVLVAQGAGEVWPWMGARAAASPFAGVQAVGPDGAPGDQPASGQGVERARQQQAILAAYNCIRTQHGLPGVILDRALSVTAGAAWARLADDPAFSLMALPGTYLTRSVVPLDGGAPGDQTSEPKDSLEAHGCVVGGFDPNVLPLAPQARLVGIAVFPPQARWDGASAVVLVKE